MSKPITPVFRCPGDQRIDGRTTPTAEVIPLLQRVIELGRRDGVEDLKKAGVK